jgi:hypothetical protein
MSNLDWLFKELFGGKLAPDLNKIDKEDLKRIFAAKSELFAIKLLTDSERSFMINRVPSYNVSIYLGKRQQYDGPFFNLEDIILLIQKFLTQTVQNCCFRIEKCVYVTGKYVEEGFSINLINYPRFPKEFWEIEKMAKELAQYLLIELNQNRISIVTPVNTFMLENPNSQDNPK